MYNAMMQLVAENEAFFFQDYVKDCYTYRVFNYRLASYTDFCKPYALEMRGITWLLQEGQDPILVSRPFEKFFNYMETPFTTGLDLSKATRYETKADGSLIATYFNPLNKTFGVKSKQAFFSEQALMAEKYLDLDTNKALYWEIYDLARSGYTVLMELCSPANRIVLEYDRTHLVVHGVRNNETGEYLSKHDMRAFEVLSAAWVDGVDVEGLPEEFISSTKLLTGIEGYVVHGPWGRFKQKTDWYCTLHHLKDSVSSNKSLVEAIIYERVDDVKAMFSTDQFTINRISEMESKVVPKFNSIIKSTEEFFEANKALDRKSFAIKATSEIPLCFHLAMAKLLGRDPDYKGFAMKFAKELFSLETTETMVQE